MNRQTSADMESGSRRAVVISIYSIHFYIVVHFFFSIPSSVSFKMSVIFCLAAFIAAVSATISPAGQTVVVNGISYYAASDVVSSIAATSDVSSSVSSSGGLIPLTVIEDTSASFTSSVFASIVSNYTATDDVFNIGFLQG